MNSWEHGMSPAQVKKLDSGHYHKSIGEKYANTTFSVLREGEVMWWLDGKLNVPQVIELGRKCCGEFLVMTTLGGKHIDEFKENPIEYAKHLANCIKLLQSIDISECSFDSGVDFQLSELKFLMDNNLHSTDDWEKTTDFHNAQELYEWLYINKPKDEELVFSHGDLTANFFVADDGYYFYDLGRAGKADKWLDIAFCVSDLRDIGDEYVNNFFHLLGVKNPNWQKIEYFILLDEMF